MKVYYILAFVLLSTHVVGQELAHFTITQQQGLPSNTVYNLYQDTEGFLWVATENGLARYNGVHFKYYSNDQVRSNAISGLFQDEQERIWLHNFFGEILFVENDSLKKLTSWEQYYTTGFPTLSSQDENLLVTAPGTFYQYTSTTKKWSSLASGIPHAEQDLHYNHHLVNYLNQVLVCYTTKEATYIQNIATGEVYTLPKTTYTLNINVIRLIEWQKEIWLFDPSGKKLFSLFEGKVKDLSSSFQKKLTYTGLIQNLGDSLLAFTGNNGIRLLSKEGTWSEFLLGKKVSSAATDTEGGLWVGTLNEGLFHFPNLHTYLFTKEKSTTFNKLALDRKHMRICAGGYDGSIHFFDYSGKQVASLLPAVNKEVQSLYVDSISNRLLVYSDQLYSYDLSTLQEIQTQKITAVKKIERIGHVYAVATSAGLLLLDAKSLNTLQSLTNLRTSSVAFDQTLNLLWIGTQKGVFTYSFLTGQLEPWVLGTPAYSPGISDMRLTSNAVFLATYTNGLLLLKDGQLEKQFTQQNGLPSSHITSLSQANTSLWIGTDKGVAHLDLPSSAIKILDETKGLVASEVYQLLQVGEMLWVSHPQGLQYFTKPTSLNTQKPILHMERVSSDGKILTNVLQGIELPPSSQQLTLSFDVSNNLRSMGTSRILYRIKELEKDNWKETSLQSPIANYLFLPSGNFTFEAYAINEDGVASANIITFPITVLAPFWKQVWFTVLVFLLSVSIITFILYSRFQQISNRNRSKLQQQNQEQELRIAQLTSIRAQMNPHFIFNTMSLIQGKVLNGLKEDANRNIQNFSQLLRKVLDFSGKEMIALQDEIDILEKYLAIEKDRFDGSLEFRIDTDEVVKQEMIRIPSLLTQPYVENALRHGLMHKEGLKRLLIKFSLENNMLLVSIDDNGIGRKASAEFNKGRKKEHNSFAMEAYQKRIDLLNSSRTQKIELTIVDKYSEHGVAAGTVVTLKVPLEL